MAKKSTVCWVQIPVRHLYVLAAELRKSSLRAYEDMRELDAMGEKFAAEQARFEQKVIDDLLGRIVGAAERVGENV